MRQCCSLARRSRNRRRVSGVELFKRGCSQNVTSTVSEPDALAEVGAGGTYRQLALGGLPPVRPIRRCRGCSRTRSCRTVTADRMKV